MHKKIYISEESIDVHEVPSMVSSEAMLGFFFIDGNNLYHNLKASRINPGSVDIVKLIGIVAKKLSIKDFRILYFNSMPSIKDGQSIYFNHLRFLEKLKKLGVQVYTRKLQRLSTKEKMDIVDKEVGVLGLCESCMPIVVSHYKDHIGDISLKEKGVDMNIAIEMIRHGIIIKDCSRIMLVSGDADFVPCMDLLSSQGVDVMSACTAKGYSYELRSKHRWYIIDKDDIKCA